MDNSHWVVIVEVNAIVAALLACGKTTPFSRSAFSPRPAPKAAHIAPICAFPVLAR